jgi:hypothetical protein
MMVVLVAKALVALRTWARPGDLIWLLLSAGAAISLTTSRGERLAESPA